MQSMVKAFDIFSARRSVWVLVIVAVLLFVQPDEAAAQSLPADVRASDNPDLHADLAKLNGWDTFAFASMTEFVWRF